MPIQIPLPFSVFFVHCLNSPLFFIFQEFTVKLVDPSRPGGSEIHQIPALGKRED